MIEHDKTFDKQSRQNMLIIIPNVIYSRGGHLEETSKPHNKKKDTEEPWKKKIF